MSSIYDPVNCDLEAFQNNYVMAPELWERFDISDLNEVDFSKWQSIKLMNAEADGFSEEVQQIPTNSGGIYVYAIQPGVIPVCGSYIMYVGMASKTAHENLQYRVKACQKEIGETYKRDRLHRLFVKWGKYVYAYYLPVKAPRETIFELETRLIGALTPPCNPDIRAKGVKRAVNAFR